MNRITFEENDLKGYSDAFSKFTVICLSKHKNQTIFQINVDELEKIVKN